MVLRPVARATALVLVVGAAGCSDVIVGQYDGSGGSAATADDAASPTEATASEGQTDTGVPATCLADDFDDGIIDGGFWNTWVEEDAALEEVGGQLRLTPPSYGVFDTGVVGGSKSSFPFTDGTVQVRVVTPPPLDRPAALFLQVGQGSEILLLGIGSATVDARRLVDDVPISSDAYPVAAYPTALGFRAQGTTIDLEIAEGDGPFTVVHSYIVSQPFEDASALIMAQTYGDNPDPATLVVDDFKACYR
ncbi:MAG: hypothetical protein K0V04_14740 [Deltaproteobacteria bacterium]|nr:hypothetical protein [Deltaproteobacteria bacterium]